MINPCFIIPVYNHQRAIANTLGSLSKLGLPCVLIDDGSDDICREELERLSETQGERIYLVVRHTNGGKGAAVKSGLRAARDLGFSHAIQIDADGQHDPADIPQFLHRCRQQPQALVCGYPIYDQSVPLGRFLGRYITHIWVWINTLSLEIRDSMCGLRCYPLAESVALIDEEFTGNRMDFDTEILVRWHWRNFPIVQLPVNVRYPVDGVSHFRGLRDNLLISAMHSRLFFGMLTRKLRKLIPE